MAQSVLIKRDRDGVSAFGLTPSAAAGGDATAAAIAAFARGPAKRSVWSEDGGAIAVLNHDGQCEVLDGASGAPKCSFEHAKALNVALSPRGTYAVSVHRFSRGEGENLYVWDLRSGERTATFYERAYSADTFPPVRWTQDEAKCARVVPSGIEVYDGADFAAGIAHKIALPNVQCFELAPPQPIGGAVRYQIATFVPERKGKAGQLDVWALPEVGVATAGKSFFKASNARIVWAPNAKALLITTSTATSGDSYYGDSGVHLLSSDGMVSCLFEGPVSDAAWRPQPALASLDAAGRKRRRPRAQFIVVAGKQPPQPTLYDVDGMELQKLERRYANTVAWSPNGETLCLAGFGNMAGKMYFEGSDPMDNPGERASDSDAVLTPLGACQASAPSQFGWTADGHFFVTACTFPRMRQGNGYEVWDRCGNRVAAEFPAAVGEMPVPGEPGKMVPIQVREPASSARLPLVSPRRVLLPFPLSALAPPRAHPLASPSIDHAARALPSDGAPRAGRRVPRAAAPAQGGARWRWLRRRRRCRRQGQEKRRGEEVGDRREAACVHSPGRPARRRREFDAHDAARPGARRGGGEEGGRRRRAEAVAERTAAREEARSGGGGGVERPLRCGSRGARSGARSGGAPRGPGRPREAPQEA